MSAVDDILADIPLSQLASQLGVDEATAEAATRQAIPALLGGMQANAQDSDGAASLVGALGNHSSALVDGGVDLNQVDTNDGQKIVNNVFGPNTDQVAQTLGGNLGGGQSGLIQKLLPILAPIVMSYLAKRLTGGTGGGAGGGLLGSILGGAMGGSSGGSGGLSDLLGGMLGGGARDQDREQPSSSPSITDILGGLLGGGRR